MKTIKRLVLASLSAIVCILAQETHAKESLTSARFLQYSAEAQRNYIVTSSIMAGLVASQNRKTQTECINDWAAQNAASGFEPVIATMKKHPQFHPSGVIIAVLQKACGSFAYK